MNGINAMNMNVEQVRTNTKLLHAHVATASAGDGHAGMGVVFVDGHGRIVRRIGRMLPETTTSDLAAFRGILYVLWNSRRLGSRRVVVHSDNPSVVAQINGDQEVEPALIGPYLEVRALLHAYRSARVEADSTGWGREALAVAEAARAGDTDDAIEDLPLWTGQSLWEKSTA